MITPTVINTQDQIYLVGSPVNVRIENFAVTSTIKSAVVELYIWTGDLDTPPTLPTKTLRGEKVSKNDTYINFQISEILASYINNTRFAWVAGGDNPPTVAGEGVFWQIKSTVTLEDGTVESPYESLSNFATNGWRYDYEQIGTSIDGQPYNGLIQEDYVNRNYSCHIPYRRRYFDFTKALNACTTENIVTWTTSPQPEKKPQLGDKYMFVYINRLGLWDYFTPFGKIAKSVAIDAEYNTRAYRNPNIVVNSVNHSKSRLINSTTQTINVNTGALTERMTKQVEELIYSPLIYLIEFGGDVVTEEEVGITVDNTIVTVDSTTVTVDSQTITENDIGYYNTFKQTPVICKTENLLFKTRLNDKNRINYDLTFEVTTDRINNVR